MSHSTSHAVAILQCRNGFILLDPRSDPYSRIFCIPRHGTIRHGEKTFTADTRGGNVRILERNSESEFEYCTNIANAEDIVSKHFIMEAPFPSEHDDPTTPSDPAFPIAAYDSEGNGGKTIWVSLLQGKLTLKNMTLPKKDPARTDRLKFDEVMGDSFHAKLSRFYNTVSPRFHIPFESLENEIMTFIENAVVIKMIFYNTFPHMS